MKKLLIALLFTVTLVPALAQETATVYLIRPKSVMGMTSSLKCFIDTDNVCKLSNGKYSMHSVVAGEHDFTIQQYGSDKRDGAPSLKIKIEPAKMYYLQVSVLNNRWLLQEITDNNAKAVMQSLSADKDCK